MARELPVGSKVLPEQGFYLSDSYLASLRLAATVSVVGSRDQVLSPLYSHEKQRDYLSCPAQPRYRVPIPTLEYKSSRPEKQSGLECYIDWQCLARCLISLPIRDYARISFKHYGL
jgi:hypothetical protein